MSTNERELAHNTQEKFEFYVISLVFTLLALAIKTGKFGEFAVADIFELLGWLCLLVSGITGLWRMEYIPVQRIKQIEQDEFETQIYKLKQLQLTGVNDLLILKSNSNQPIPERIDTFQNAVNALNPVAKKVERSNRRKYYVHRYLFVAGLACLFISRSYAPVTNLVRSAVGY